jgi:hypothetical protein
MAAAHVTQQWIKCILLFHVDGSNTGDTKMNKMHSTVSLWWQQHTWHNNEWNVFYCFMLMAAAHVAQQWMKRILLFHVDGSSTCGTTMNEMHSTVSCWWQQHTCHNNEWNAFYCFMLMAAAHVAQQWMKRILLFYVDGSSTCGTTMNETHSTVLCWWQRHTCHNNEWNAFYCFTSMAAAHVAQQWMKCILLFHVDGSSTRSTTMSEMHSTVLCWWQQHTWHNDERNAFYCFMLMAAAHVAQRWMKCILLFHVDGSSTRGTSMNEMHSTVSMPKLSKVLCLPTATYECE